MLKNSLLKISILLNILFSNSHALKKDEIEKEMANRIDNVLLVLKKKDLSKEEKKKEVINIVDDTFDFELMAKIALGKILGQVLVKRNKKNFQSLLKIK